MGVSPHDRARPDPWKKPYQVRIGTDFGPVEDVDAQTRDFLARFIAFGAAAAVTIAGAYSLYNREYAAIATVWAVAGPIFGSVMTYYFGSKRNHAA